MQTQSVVLCSYKNTILTIIFALITIIAFTQEVKEVNVAIIYLFDKNNNIEKENETYLQSQLTEKIVEAEHYTAFTRTDINAIVDEYNFQETGMVKDDERQKIGQMTGATHICVSNFINGNNSIIIIAKIIEIKTGKIIVEQNIEINKKYINNDYEVINSYSENISENLHVALPTIQSRHQTMSYNNINEGITYINERIVEDNISIDKKIVWSSYRNFKINKVIFSYGYEKCSYRDKEDKRTQHFVEIICKKKIV